MWFKLANWFWRGRFWNFVNVFSPFRNSFPLEKSGPFFWTNLNPLHPRMLCAKFGWNWLSSSGEEDFEKLSIYFYYFRIISPLGRAWKMKMWKVYRQTDGRTDRRTDRQTDDRWSEKLTWAFSSGELKPHTFLGTWNLRKLINWQQILFYKS